MTPAHPRSRSSQIVDRGVVFLVSFLLTFFVTFLGAARAGAVVQASVGASPRLRAVDSMMLAGVAPSARALEATPDRADRQAEARLIEGGTSKANLTPPSSVQGTAHEPRDLLRWEGKVPGLGWGAMALALTQDLGAAALRCHKAEDHRIAELLERTLKSTEPHEANLARGPPPPFAPSKCG